MNSMAKTIDKTYFDVVSMDGWHGLAVSNKDTFELLVEEINEIVARAKRLGYDNDEKWLIVSARLVRKWDDNGVFVSEEISKTAYALYDNGKVTVI